MYKGKTKVIHTCLNFPEHILSYIFCQCYMRFLILLFSFIFRHWIFSAISQCRFWEQSQGKSRDATNGRNHCQKYLQKGFSWVIYHNYWKCHCQKYLNKYYILILQNIKIFQDHSSVFLALGIHLPFKKIKGKISTWEKDIMKKYLKTKSWKCFFRVVHYTHWKYTDWLSDPSIVPFESIYFPNHGETLEFMT